MDGRRVLIATKLDVLEHGGVDASVPEGADGIDFGRTLLLNLNTIAEGVRHSFFGGDPNGAVGGASLPGIAYVGVALAVVVVGVAAYLWRYQQIEA